MHAGSNRGPKTNRWLAIALTAAMAGCAVPVDENGVIDDTAVSAVTVGTSTAWAQPVGELPAGEASGAVASRRYPGILWWHRDGGPENGNPRNAIFAQRFIDGRPADLSPGVRYRAITVPGETNQQWEDMAADGNGNLWVGQIGNCASCAHYVLRFPEPDPMTATQVGGVQKYYYRFPDSFQNAEAMIVVGGMPYIFTKGSPTRVYRFTTLNTGSANPNVLRYVGNLNLPGSNISAADLSVDRTHFVVGTHLKLWVYEIPDATRQLSGEAFVSAFITQPPVWKVDFSAVALNVEGIAFANANHDLALFAENKDLYYFPRARYEE